MLALVAGIAIGGGLTSVQAQVPKKPAFVIAEVDVTDEAAFKAYAAKVPDTIKPYNARIIIRGKPDNKEGETPKGIIVALAFDSMDDAEKVVQQPSL